MAVDLGDYVDTLRREVNPPGVDIFTDAGEDDYIGYMADAFWEASLDGFLKEWSCDPDGLITPVAVGGEDLPRGEVALIVLYAGIKMLRNRILNLNTGFKAKAGPVEFEQQNSATMLVEMLRQLKSNKDRILAQSDNFETLDSYFDAYSTRAYSDLSYSGGPELTGF